MLRDCVSAASKQKQRHGSIVMFNPVETWSVQDACPGQPCLRISASPGTDHSKELFVAASDTWHVELPQSADPTGHRNVRRSMATRSALEENATVPSGAVLCWCWCWCCMQLMSGGSREMRLCRKWWEDPPGPQQGFSGIRRNTIMTSQPAEMLGHDPSKSQLFSSESGSTRAQR